MAKNEEKHFYGIIIYFARFELTLLWMLEVLIALLFSLHLYDFPTTYNELLSNDDFFFMNWYATRIE